MWNKLKGGATYYLSNPAQKHVYQQGGTIKTHNPLQSLQDMLEELKESLAQFDSLPTREVQLQGSLGELIEALEGLVLMVHDAAELLRINELKLINYDKVNDMATRHQQIVTALQLEHSQLVERLNTEQRQVQHQLKDHIAKIETDIAQLTQNNNLLRQKVTSLYEQRDTLNKKYEKVQQLRMEAENKFKEAKIKVQSLINTKETRMPKPKVTEGWQYALPVVLIYNKYRTRIASFLTVKDLVRLCRIDRFTYSTMIRHLPQCIAWTVQKTAVLSNLERQNKASFFDKAVDTFCEQENVRIGAIKYIFFKIRPGSYLLPYFQHQEGFQASNRQEGFGSLLKRKLKEGGEKYTVDSLRKHSEYKRLESKLDEFFRGIIMMKLPEDLKEFQRRMTEEIEQIKIKVGSPSTKEDLLSAVLVLSKLLFVEAGQVTRLLQACFDSLLLCTSERDQLRLRLSDHSEQSQVLKGTMEELAKEKVQMQKFIWGLQSQLSAERHSKNKLETELQVTNGKLKTLSLQLNQTTEHFRQFRDQTESNILRSKAIEANFEKIKSEIYDFQKSV